MKSVNRRRQSGDHVVYFVNGSPEAVAESGTEGLALIRGGQIVMRVVQPGDNASLENHQGYGRVVVIASPRRLPWLS